MAMNVRILVKYCRKAVKPEHATRVLLAVCRVFSVKEGLINIKLMSHYCLLFCKTILHTSFNVISKVI